MFHVIFTGFAADPETRGGRHFSKGDFISNILWPEAVHKKLSNELTGRRIVKSVPSSLKFSELLR